MPSVKDPNQPAPISLGATTLKLYFPSEAYTLNQQSFQAKYPHPLRKMLTHIPTPSEFTIRSNTFNQASHTIVYAWICNQNLGIQDNG